MCPIRYLKRRPMTTTDLLKKFRSKKTGIQNAQLVTSQYLSFPDQEHNIGFHCSLVIHFYHRSSFLLTSWRRSIHTSTRSRESPTCPSKRKSEQKDFWTSSINVQDCHWGALVKIFLEMHWKNFKLQSFDDEVTPGSHPTYIISDHFRDLGNLNKWLCELENMSEFKQLKLKAEKKRHVRKKRDSFSDDEEINQEEFDKTRELQKLRKRPAGTNIVTLALGKKINKVQTIC